MKHLQAIPIRHERRSGNWLIPGILGLVSIVAVAIFGGVQPRVFLPIGCVLVLLAAFGFSVHGWPRLGWFGRVICAVLIGVPLLQLLPLPAGAVALLSPARVALLKQLQAAIGPAGAVTLSVERHATMLALLHVVAYVFAFLLALRYCESRRSARVFVIILIGLGVAEAVYGMVQYLTGWQYIFNYPKHFYLDDATGTYINRNHFAGLLELIAPFLVARLLIASTESRSQASLKQMILSPGSSRILVNGLLFCVMGIALFFSRSRMGIASAFLSVLLVIFIAGWRGRRRAALSVLLLLVLPLLYASWIGLDPVFTRFEALGSNQYFELDRTPIWRDTLRLIRDYPLVGTGLGTYHSSSLHYQTTMLDKVYEHAHNDYLEVAADVGIPAALLLFAGLWCLLFRITRAALWEVESRRKVLLAGCAGALLALLLHSGSDFNFQIPANALIFASVAGMGAGLAARAETTRAMAASAAAGRFSPRSADLQ